MDIICVDDNFSLEALEFWDKYKVTTPKKDKLYTIRDVIINSTGETGLLLNEIHNPKVPIKHPLFITANIEPNWHEKRFRTLSKQKLNIIQLKNEIKIRQYQK